MVDKPGTATGDRTLTALAAVSLPAVLLYLVLSRRLGGAFTFGGAMKG